MDIKNNNDLRAAVNSAIDESGYKKQYIADKLGISKQAFSRFMQKQNFSLDDANKVLNIIGYDTITKVNKKS